MLTVPEAAARAGRSPETIRRWIRSGKLAATKVGTQHVISEAALDAFFAGQSRTGEAGVPYGDSPAWDDEPDPRLKRITINPRILGGAPAVKGTRMGVEHVLDYLAGGWTIDELVAEFPHLTDDDIRACLAYARAVVASEVIVAIK